MRITLDIDIESDAQAVTATWDEPATQTPVLDTSGPLRDDQRRALFAAFGNVFGRGAGPEARHLFTRMVLGVDADEPVSWSSWRFTAITASEASRLLDVLDVVERTMVAVEAEAA